MKYKNLFPLVKKVDSLYKKLVPLKYQYQKKQCNKVKKYCISDSVFTTLTVNYNWQTACHIDQGDLTDGFSCITVSEEGKWTGGYLGLPRFGISFNVRGGDILIFNPHEYHCNSKIIGKSKEYTRLSIVYYFREGMLNCQSRKFSKTKRRRSKKLSEERRKKVRKSRKNNKNSKSKNS